MTAPLTGCRVLELGSLIAGPFATRLLADFGAEVIKVETPGRPDPLREWGRAEQEGHRLWWSVQSRNKKCVTLDLKMEEGRDLFLDLIAESDVLVENFRPGTLERLRLEPEVLHARNERLVVARVSGYGQAGPSAHLPGYASVAEAVSGLRHLNGYPDRPPPRTGISLGDSLAALFAVQGILMALYWRDVHPRGRGQVVDVSLVEACFALLESGVPDFASAGIVAMPSGTRIDGIAPSNLYPTKDGRWLVIAANQDSVFRRLAEAMGTPDLADDDRFATHTSRGRNQDELDSIVASWAAELHSETIIDMLTESGVPVGPVNTVEDLFHDPQLAYREMLVAKEDPRIGQVIHPGIVPKLTVTPGDIAWSGPPDPGTHNAEIYSDLIGRSPDELARLRTAGVI